MAKNTTPSPAPAPTPAPSPVITTPPPKPKYPWFDDEFVKRFKKDFKKFIIRIHVSDGAYNDEMITELTYKARHVADGHGNVIVDFRKELELFMEEVGRRGYTVKSEDGLTYYPPQRIHYIEVVDPKNDDN